MAMGPVLKESGEYAITIPAGANQDAGYRFLPMFYKAGGRVFNEDWTKAAFNGPAGLATLEYLVSITGYSLVPEEAWTVLKVLWARRSAVARAQSDDGRIARAKGRLRAGCGV